MDKGRMPPVRHVIAWMASIGVLVSLPVCLYFALVLATADMGGPLNLVLIPCANGMVATIVVTALFLPASALVEWLVGKLRPAGHFGTLSVVAAGIICAINLTLVVGAFALWAGVILESPWALQVIRGHDRRAVVEQGARILWFGGVPVALGATLYWFLLRASDRFLRWTRDKRP